MNQHSSTTPPFSGVSTSSNPPPVYNYGQSPTPPVSSGTSGGSRFTGWELGFGILTLILTGVVGYFSALISVKSDIASNREGISVLKVGVESLDGDVKRIEKKVDQTDRFVQDQAGFKVRIGRLEDDVSRLEDRAVEKQR
ncbi:hypothetical protein NG726_24605 [Pseudomonas sp. MOB-449]|nr:hypothetical protein [Pseudomonas sp. MOB-449]